MKIVHHTEECAGRPVNGRLTGVCDCATAPLSERATRELDALLKETERASAEAAEDPAYLAIRMNLLRNLAADAEARADRRARLLEMDRKTARRESEARGRSRSGARKHVATPAPSASTPPLRSSAQKARRAGRDEETS